MARLTLPDQSTIDAPTSLQAWQLADIQRATLPELERARQLADSPAAWAEFVDPGATTPFESETPDARLAYALLCVVANR